MSKARDLANAGTALTTVSATELGYLDGVTSAVQTQIDSKIGSASAINPTIVDAKGDIIAATAADTVARLAVGSNDTILTADSSTATGLKWAAPAVGGGMTLLSTTATTSGTSIDISSISQSYKTLYVVGQGINRTSTSSIRITLYNGATQLDATYTLLWTTNSVNLPTQPLYPDANNGQIGTTQPTNFELTIPNYANTSFQKSFNFRGGFFRAGSDVVGFNANGSIISTSAVNKINIYADYAFNAGQILVYGVN